ncbi:MAG TPA: aspartate ammonia-lyase [Kiritimatiellae bacterium]|nr:aspartate ammonia-lyase [Kiritimatiellia bacterium]
MYCRICVADRMSGDNFRTEKDALGEMAVPADALYGIHTARSRQNFGSAGEPLALELMHAMAWIKIACARANRRLERLDGRRAEAIEKACRAILSAALEDQFPVDVFQAGSGTSSHMNLNEVIANLANEQLGGRRGHWKPIHPNDQVNLGQSTNNVFPSAARIAARIRLRPLGEAARRLADELAASASRFSNVAKSGRTHLQDAVPMALGAEFAAWARAIEKDIQRFEYAETFLRELGVGGNAVGTALNNPPSFREMVVEEINRLLAADYVVARDGVEATQFVSDMAHLAGSLRVLAADLYKIASDLRLLASGPRTGLAELRLPAVEPGSSMMPGKVNPSICEAVNMACLHVMGLDVSIAFAAALGQLELNTHMPLVGHNLLKAMRIMEDACRRLAEKCIRGIEANRETCLKHFHNSAALLTILAPRIGYDQATALGREAAERGVDIGTLLEEKQLMSRADWDELVRRSTGLPAD